MRRLYLQIYFTIVGSLIRVLLAAGLMWRFTVNIPPFGQSVELAGAIAAGLVPPINASRDQQQQAISQLAARFATDIALFDATGERIASAGKPVPISTLTAAPAGCPHAPVPPIRSISRTADGSLGACRDRTARPRSCSSVFLGALAVAVALGALPVARRLTCASSDCNTGCNR